MPTDGTNVYAPPAGTDVVAIDTVPVTLPDTNVVERQRVYALLRGLDPSGAEVDALVGGHDPHNSTTAALAANPSVSTAHVDSTGKVVGDGVITSGSTAITTTAPFFTSGMNGLGISDSLGYIPIGTTLTYIDSTHATLSAPATGTATNDLFTSALAAPSGAVYQGTYQSSAGLDGMTAFVFTDAPLSKCQVEWSADGSTPAPSLLANSDLIAGVQAFTNIPSLPGTTLYIYLLTMTTMIDRYYRLHIVNGATATTLFSEGDVWLYDDGFAGSYGALSAPLSNLSVAQLTRAVVAAYDPDNNFINIRTQGRDSGNSTTTPLAANAVFRGKWFPWQENYVKALIDLHSDVDGTFYFDLSQDATPTDGDESSVDMSLPTGYSAATDQLLRREYPAQARWYRTRYVNGPAAQSEFELDAALVTSDPGLTTSPLRNVPSLDNLAGRVRNVQAVPDGTGAGYHEVPVDSSGVPEVHITKVDDDLLLRGLTTSSVRQVQVGTTPVQLDPTKLTNRRSAAITNMDESATPTTVYIGHSNAITSDAGTFPIVGKGEKGGAYGPNVDLWAVCKNTGGVQTTYDRPGNTAGGTGANVGNALASDNAYATLAQGQTVDVSGFTAGTANPLVSVRMCIECSKQSGQFETVTCLDVTTGSAGNVGSVSTATNVPVASKMFYLVFISRESAATVTGVTGLGLTWLQVASEPSDDAHRTLDVWKAPGSPTTAGIVTATFSTTATNSHIAVLRFYGVDQTTPVQAFSVNHTNSTAVTVPGLAGTNKGMAVLGVAQDGTTSTPGTGYTEQSDQQSSSGTIDGLSIDTKPLISTGTESPTSTLAASKHYAAIGVTLTPAAAYDPVITLTYKLSGVVGATSATVTLSNTVDAVTKIDITGDRSWVVGDVPNIDIIATATTVSGSQPQVDQIFLELIDTTANTVRVALREIA